MDRVVKFLEKGIYLNLRDMEIKVVNGAMVTPTRS